MEKISLSDGEWKLMEALWRKPPKTITQLTKELYEQTQWSKHTIITMLNRLEAKQAVRHEEGEKAKEFYPVSYTHLIYRLDGRVLEHTPINRQRLNAFFNLPTIKKVPRIFVLSSEGTFTVRMKNPTIFEIRLKVPRISMEQLRALDTIWQFSLGCKDEAMAAQCAEEINCQLGENFCAYYNQKAVDVVAAGVSKSVGIRRYMDLEGKTAEQILVIGDGGNDVDMIRDFNGYTIQTGCEAAKQAAAGIFDSVEELIKNALQENTGVV